MTLKNILVGIEKDFDKAVAYAKALSVKSIIRQLVLIALIVVVFFVVAPWARDIAAALAIILLLWKIYIEAKKIIILKNEASKANAGQAPPAANSSS